MSRNAQPKRYGIIAQSLHWLIALLMGVQVALGLRADELPLGLAKLVVLARHKSFGVTILVLAAARLAWRLAHAPPPLPDATSSLERRLASAAHSALYGLLFALPLSGWLMSSAANYTVSVFGLVSLPNPIKPDAALLAQLKTLHRLLGIALAVLLSLHLAAVMRHHFILKDDVLSRMLPRPWTGRRS
jgi:cytochrome b561